MRSYILSVLLLTLVVASPVAAQTETSPQEKEAAVEKEIAVIETNHGNIEIEFFREDAPKTVENFVQLAKRGYYDGVLFHRVISGFVIQGGDPTGTGSGGESIYGKRFDEEIDRNSALYEAGYTRGIVAMANAGPNTNGSQFFIMHKDYGLTPDYTIFGRVVTGMDTVDKIASVQTAAGGRPMEDVKMLKVYLK